MRGLLIFGVLVLVALVALVAALAVVGSRNGNVLSALTRARVAATYARRISSAFPSAFSTSDASSYPGLDHEYPRESPALA